MGKFNTDEEKKEPILSQPSQNSYRDKSNILKRMEEFKPLKKELDEIESIRKGNNIEFVDGGIVVDGLFVADKGLDYKQASTAAKNYYRAKYGNGKSYGQYDNFQWFNPTRNKQAWEMQTTKEGERTLRTGSKKDMVSQESLDEWSAMRDRYNELYHKDDRIAYVDQHLSDNRNYAGFKDLEQFKGLLDQGYTTRQALEAGAAVDSEAGASNEPEGVAPNTNNEQINKSVEVADSNTNTSDNTNVEATGSVSTTAGSNNTGTNTGTGSVKQQSSTSVSSRRNSGAVKKDEKGTEKAGEASGTSGTGEDEEVSRGAFSDLFKEERKKAKQEKTAAEKMKKYYALSDALKVIGDMGGHLIGGGIGGNAMVGTDNNGEYKPSRGYIEAFEKAKAAEAELDKLNLEERKYILDYEKKKEEREYKANQAAIVQQYKIEMERIRQEYKTANEERRAELRAQEIAARQKANEGLAILRASLQHNNNLDYLDARTEAELEIIDHRTEAKSSASNIPVRFHDNTTMQIPETYYNSMKRDFVGENWNGKKVTKDNVDLYIKNNPEAVKAYLDGFGVSVSTSSSGSTSGSTSSSSASSGSRSGASSGTTSGSSSGGTSSGSGNTTLRDELMNL